MSIPAEEVQNLIDQANGNEPVTPVEEKDVDADLWADIATDLDESEEELVSKPEVSEEEPKPQEPVAPEPEVEVPPATQPAEEIKEAVQESAPEVVPPQPITPPQPIPEVVQTPPQPTMSPEEYKAKQVEDRAKAVDEMARNYSLSEEEATTFLTDPGAIVPKFRAELFMDVFDATTKALLQAVPALVTQVNLQTKVHNEQEESFYTANPLLDKATHGETVNRYAQAYVQAVPNASPEQVIKDVGIQVMFALGINPAQTAVKEKGVDETPAPAPYVPPGAGQASSASVADPYKDNPWAKIAEELEEDD